MYLGFKRFQTSDLFKSVGSSWLPGQLIIRSWMTLAEAQLDLIFSAACHDVLFSPREVGISFPCGFGNRLRTPSVLCLCCNIEFWQFCEVDLPAEDIFSITRTV